MEVTSEAAKNGVVNQIVAYPYASMWKMAGVRNAINARKTSSVGSGYTWSPMAPMTAATIMATSGRASRIVRSIGIRSRSDYDVADEADRAGADPAGITRSGPARRRAAPRRGAGRGTYESGCSVRHVTKSLSFASTVSITWLSTYSGDSPRNCAYAYKVSLVS